MRAFQQTFVFLVLPFMLGIIYLGQKLYKHLGLAALTVVSVLFMALFTNFLPQLTGGVPASLNLNNSGPYYGDHYAHQSDLLAFAWLKNNVPHNAGVRSADYTSAFAHDPHYPFTKTGILPFQVSPNDYVLLQYYQVVKGIVYINVAHNLLPIRLTSQEYANKNLIYTTQDSQIYK
jgi:uncharacterized membrane protein